MHTVYKIQHKGKDVYYGRTNNIERRQKEHRYHYRRYLQSDDVKGKMLYMFLEDANVDPVDIVLMPVAQFKTKTMAKRFEMYRILYYQFDYFSGFTLQQRVPPISDR